MHDDGQTRVSQGFAQTTGGQFGVAALMRDVHVAIGASDRAARFLHQFDDAFGPHGKTDAGRGLAAQHFDERIVTTAAANRALRAQTVRDPFKDRVVVVVQTTHQTRIDRVIDAQSGDAGFQTLQERQGILTQEIEQTGRRIDQILHLRVLGVQNAQGVGVQTADASTIVPVATALSGSGKGAFIAEYKAEQARLCAEFEQKEVPLYSLAESRTRALQSPAAQPIPQRTGVFTVGVPAGCSCHHPQPDFPLTWQQLLDKADWSITLRTFGMHAARTDEKKLESDKLRADAEAILKRALAENHIQARSCFGIWPASRHEDDIEVQGGTVLYTLRQQKISDNPRVALSDFVGTSNGYVGAMQMAISGADEWSAELNAANDPYNALLIAAVANMLAEALAECTQDCVEQVWPIAGSAMVRPACGYPSQPDHQEKRTVFSLLNASAHTGTTLTETCMMQPSSAICALIFNHPEARYFAVGPIGEDQRADYESRSGHKLTV